MSEIEPIVVPFKLDIKPQLGPLVAQMRELGIRRLKLDDVEVELEANGDPLSTFAAPVKAEGHSSVQVARSVDPNLALYSMIEAPLVTDTP